MSGAEDDCNVLNIVVVIIIIIMFVYFFNGLCFPLPFVPFIICLLKRLSVAYALAYYSSEEHQPTVLFNIYFYIHIYFVRFEQLFLNLSCTMHFWTRSDINTKQLVHGRKTTTTRESIVLNNKIVNKSPSFYTRPRSWLINYNVADPPRISVEFYFGFKCNEVLDRFCPFGTLLLFFYFFLFSSL